MLESKIQRKKIKQLEKEGYYVIKLITTNKPGIPDLIAIPRDSDVLFIEVKAGKNTTSKLQDFRIKELNEHGITTEVFRQD
jgi:Holliday junction resolvase